MHRVVEAYNAGEYKFIGGHFCYSNLRGANLRGADFTSADLLGADLRDADLRDAELRAANLKGADFRGANLQGANLCLAITSGADLRNANLRYTNLSYSILFDANLRGSDLCDSDLHWAILHNADITDTCLINGGERSDGWRFIGHFHNGALRIIAGCRYFTIPEARKHWQKTRGGTPLGDETLAIIDCIEEGARAHEEHNQL